LKTIGDKEIWDEIKKGNVSAFEELYYRYANKLLKEVSCRIFDENTVEDLIQDIFLSLWEKRENYQVRGPIYPYLHGMAINRVLNFYRQHKLTPKFVEIWEQISRDQIQLEDLSLAFEQSQNEQMMSMLDVAVEALPPRMREIYELRYRQGLSIPQIAQKLQITSNTVYNQLKSIKKKFLKTVRNASFVFFL